MWERTYVILVDECTRWCMVENLERKTLECWLETVYQHWIRYFGPMRTLVSDQEGALASELAGRLRERFDVAREFGGPQGHTSAPVAGRRIAL
eukprot:11816121-Alexandrium_andersonii.AAC.1